MTETKKHVVIIGAGFTGLAAAYELTRRGLAVTVLERDQEVGGLASTFNVNGYKLEKFYHHWFTSDEHVNRLVAELNAEDRIVLRSTRTGMYYANNIFRLSKPLELLQFTPLNLLDRIRLGLMVLRARMVKDWRPLERVTAEQWLLDLGGPNVFRVVWEPLLRGKFGPFASEISAVWFWNKLKLRGGSRGKGEAETLAYYKGGFGALSERVAEEVTRCGGTIVTGTEVTGLLVESNKIKGVKTGNGEVLADAVLATQPLPLFADLVEPFAPAEYANSLREIKYLANICLVLELDRSLSDTYWLNVNDASFPFVGLIEHTNFDPPENYGGRHIVYLSKYLPESDALFQLSEREYLEYCLPYIQRMFPSFDRGWILNHHVWRANYSQPIVGRLYSQKIPQTETPISGLYVSNMAQIYPEDRGTNYAIREGRLMGVKMADSLAG